MRSKCTDEGVGIFWGLQLMVILVQKKKLTKDEAIKAAEIIKESNMRITDKNMADFKKKILDK